MLYLADNLAYFPFQVQDEPLFIVHHIDTVLSLSGTNLLQAFREVNFLYIHINFAQNAIFA
jgi:cohesin loading factor subunit SCC2